MFNRTEHISILFLSHSREFLDPRMVEWLIPKTVYKFSDRPCDRDPRNLWFRIGFRSVGSQKKIDDASFSRLKVRFLYRSHR